MVFTVENDLKRTSPEQQGIASSAVLQFVDALENQIPGIHSFMLLRHGSVIAEAWWSPYGYEHPHMMYSLSKSFTSTAIGLAVNENLLSIDDPVLSFFPDEAPDEVSALLQQMQVRHLLSMSTGHDVDSWPHMVNRPDDNWIKGFLEVPVLHTPGTHFVYNTGATYMLSAILQKITGMKLVDYLQQPLFEPLGISKPTWQESPQGINLGGTGLSIKTEDIARLGQLYLQKGMWQGNQIVPEAWVSEATTMHVSNSNSGQMDWAQGYGYQFWRCHHNAYRGDGAFGQYCIVMPDQDAVLAITSGLDLLDMQQPLNLVWDILLPAMQSGTLPDDPAAYDTLVNRLGSLSMLPVQGESTSPLVAQVSGQIYQVDTNDLTLETIAFSFTEAGCAITLKTATDTETILCGYDVWQRAQTTLFKQRLLFDQTKTATSGAWADEDVFTMVFRLYETPFYYTVSCHFTGDDLIIESQVNISMESTKPVILTAHHA